MSRKPFFIAATSGVFVDRVNSSFLIIVYNIGVYVLYIHFMLTSASSTRHCCLFGVLKLIVVALGFLM